MSYFPMFIQLKKRPCLVVGGGKIALHKVRVLSDFGAEITVIAPEILPEIKQINGVICREQEMKAEDIDGWNAVIAKDWELVVAATDNALLNHQVSRICREKKIPVNAVDQPEDCSFIFPAYLREGEVVAAFSSGGQSPVITQYLKNQMRPAMKPQLGEIAACMGNLREMVKQQIKTEQERKVFYQKLLQYALEKDSVPTGEEILRFLSAVLKDSVSTEEEILRLLSAVSKDFVPTEEEVLRFLSAVSCQSKGVRDA